MFVFWVVVFGENIKLGWLLRVGPLRRRFIYDLAESAVDTHTLVDRILYSSQFLLEISILIDQFLPQILDLWDISYFNF